MKHKLKIITLLTLGAVSTLINAQVPNQPMQPVINQTVPMGQPMPMGATNTTVTSTGTKVEIPAQPTINDYSHLGEGNAYEKAVTPLLREISRKKSILELKKLDKEIAKLDEVDKKDVSSGMNSSSPYLTMPPPIPPSSVSRLTAPTMPMGVPTPTVTSAEDMAIMANPVKVLMTYGDENDLYAKIAVGDQGGYTVRKGDILPDGRTVLRVNSNYMEVEQAVKTKKSTKVKTQKIFVSSANSNSGITINAPSMGGSSVLPSATMPTLATIPAANNAIANSMPAR